MTRLLLAAGLVSALALPATAQTRTGLVDLDAADECAILDVAGYGSVSVEIIGTWVGTITFRVQGEGGTRDELNVSKADAPETSATTTAANGLWSASIAGYRTALACMTSYTSGTASVRMSASPASPAVTARPSTSWMASLDAIGATLTEIRAAPASGLSLYLTGYTAGSTTATAGLHLLRYGTGTNCGTGTTTLFPGTGTTARIASPANTIVPTVVTFPTPIQVTAANAVCLIGVATNTTWMVLTGFTAP